jgi:agmatine deiminase
MCVPFTGVRKIIWLPRGLYADEDTNGHIDNFCCFVKPAVVLLAWTDDENDPQYEISREAEAVLASATDALGRSMTVIKMPIPPAMYYTEEDQNGCKKWGDSPSREAGDRLAGSYVNFYLANGGIVCPAFDAPTDIIAAEILAKAYPDCKVVQVPGRDILLGGGNIHCITQQEPMPM